MRREVDSLIWERGPTWLIEKNVNVSPVPTPMLCRVELAKLSKHHPEAEVSNPIWKGKAYACGTTKAHTGLCWAGVKGVFHQSRISAELWEKWSIRKSKRTIRLGKLAWLSFKMQIQPPSKESLIDFEILSMEDMITKNIWNIINFFHWLMFNWLLGENSLS